MEQLSLVPTQEILAHSTKASTTESGRILVIDQLRGIAMILMALEHAASFANVSLQAEGFGGQIPVLPTLPHVLIGMFTHQASGIFFTLTGTSVSFFENGRRKRGWTEWQISRFFIIRAGILLVLDQIINMYAFKVGIAFDVLSAIAVCLIMIAFLRLLQPRVLVLLAVGLFLIYPLLVQALPYRPDQPLSTLTTILVGYKYDAPPYVGYPALARLSLVLIGYVGGRLLQEGRLKISRRMLWWALAGLLIALALRLLGGYGNFLPYRSDEPLIYFFVESKQPPSIVFLLSNFAIALTWLVGLNALEPRIKDNMIGKVLAVFGQTALFFYVAHLFLYSLIISPHFPDTFRPMIGDFGQAVVECAVGLIILYFACYGYRRLRRKYALLHYL